MSAPEEEKKSKLLKELVGSDCLPSLSPLIIQLLEMAADEGSSASDLARIIEQDPSLAARLIKMVNSVHYARRKTISSLSQAVVMIGFNKLRVMALSISLRDTFPLGKVGNMDYEYFWKASLYRAFIAQGFAQALPAAKAVSDDEAFTAGLILEIGLLMLYRICPGPLKDSFPGANALMNDILIWEEKNLGINHREIGRTIFNRWHFPPQIVQTQKYFGADALTEEQSDLCKIVELARCSAQVLLGQEGNFEIIQEAARRLDLDAARINEILCSTFTRVEAAAEHLRLKVDSNQDILEVMEKANRALARMNGSLETNLGKIIGFFADYEKSDAKMAIDIAQERQKAVKDVLDAVAHEIRNPLMAIGGFAQRMAQVVETGSDLLKYADIIVKESGRLENVLNEVVAF
ncbi:MAG: HDOD domain-containing protein, partial [Desulforhabdus sp.]|nr:HDOD domain-containing protein [Desulforhabdus sp.]